MSAAQNLKDVYIDELKDLWSANEQMHGVVKKMVDQAGDPKVQELLSKSIGGITQHSEAIRMLITNHGETAEPEHCRGMEGLVKEARKHALDDDIEDDDVRDVIIISQYQRMSHYGIAGFGTAAAYAEALGLAEDSKVLNGITEDIYGGDEYATLLAERSVNLAAK